MDKNKTLKEIFDDDTFGLLDIKSLVSPSRNEEERLIASFIEINNFYEKEQREPQPSADIQEHQLFSRLKSLRENPTKIGILQSFDINGLLEYEQKQINSLDDVLNDDVLGLLNDDSEGLYEYKHIKKQEDRASSEFIARRKPCKNFNEYEQIFKEVQKDLSNKKRNLIPFKQDNLIEHEFYVHNGVLLYLEKIEYKKEFLKFKSGSRLRKDGRTRIIFENGTESNMLYRSLYKILLANGNAISEHIDKLNEKFIETYGNITDEDKESGYIYILKSKSDKKEIKEIHNLYKIGYSTISVEERIKKASQEPTYLMADVRIVMAYKCYNMNTQKLEQLLHNFFGNSCLNLDIYDKLGNRHTPREWFIAPLYVIEQAIQFIINGEIVNYRYDSFNEQIIPR